MSQKFIFYHHIICHDDDLDKIAKRIANFIVDKNGSLFYSSNNQWYRKKVNSNFSFTDCISGISYEIQFEKDSSSTTISIDKLIFLTVVRNITILK